MSMENVPTRIDDSGRRQGPRASTKRKQSCRLNMDDGSDRTGGRMLSHLPHFVIEGQPDVWCAFQGSDTENDLAYIVSV